MLNVHSAQLAGELLPILRWANPDGTIKQIDAFYHERYDLLSACVCLSPNGHPQEDTINLYLSVSLADADLNQAALEIQLAWSDGERIDDWPPIETDFQTYDDLAVFVNTILAIHCPDLIRTVTRFIASRLEPRFAPF